MIKRFHVHSIMACISNESSYGHRCTVMCRYGSNLLASDPLFCFFSQLCLCAARSTPRSPLADATACVFERLLALPDVAEALGSTLQVSTLCYSDHSCCHGTICASVLSRTVCVDHPVLLVLSAGPCCCGGVGSGMDPTPRFATNSCTWSNCCRACQRRAKGSCPGV